MKPIENPPPPPISRESEQAVIANLHEALLFLLAKQRLHLPEDVAIELRQDSDQGTYGNGTMRAVIAFRQQYGLESGEVVDEPTARELNRLLEALDAFAPPLPEWVVRGQVVDGNGPVKDIKVVAHDRDLGAARQLLGEAVTNAGGAFHIAYAADAFLAAEGERAPRKAAPDLIFELGRGEERVTPLAVVRLLPSGEAAVAPDELLLGIAAREDEEVRIVLPVAATVAEADEYSALWRAILPLLPEQPPGDAGDAEREERVCRAALQLDEAERRDVTFVAREIGWPVPLVERFVNACRMSGRDFDGDVSPAELYGLAWAGYPDMPALASAGLANLDEALRRAAAGAIIPPVDAARATQVAELIRRRAPRRLLEPAAGDVRPLLAQTLELTGLDTAGQARLLRFAADFEGTTAQFWRELRGADGLGEQAGRVEYVMQLGALTGQNVALMRAIDARFPAAHSLRDLTLGIDEAQLRAILDAPEVTLAPHALGAGPAEQKELLAKSMAGLLSAADPTAAIAAIARSLSQEASSPVSAAAARLLERAAEQPDFDLLTSPATELASLYDGDADQLETAVREVRRMQRLARISTSPANFEGLMRSTFNAAADLPATYTRSGFVATHANALGGPAEAELTYRRAVAVSAAAMTAAVQAYQISADVQPYATLATPEESGAIATWANLFGSVELCECEHCRSWYGPAAYLVDLLLFLEKRNSANGPIPLDVLLQRRPDLAHLQLTCENSNTTLPLIDLVNEILESYTVLRDDFATFKGHDVAGETAAELRAAPQHVEQAAYDELADGVYPIGLPFERWLEVARAVLARLEAPRHALMSAFAGAPGAPDGAAHRQRVERLGLSEREHRLVTGANMDGSAADLTLASLYGLAPGVSPNELAAELPTARAFQEQLGLTFDDLAELMSCRFVNPALELDGSLQQVFEDFALDAARLRSFVTAGFTADAELTAHLAQRDKTPAQLKELLDELFAGRIGELIIFHGVEGDPTHMELLHADGRRLTNDELWRMATFVRLWRKLGWPMAELDRALRAFGCVATITPEALDNLDGLATLQKLWDTRAVELLALWADLDTTGPDAPYRRLFLARSLGSAPDPDFTLRFKEVTQPNGETSFVVTNGEKEMSGKAEAIAHALRQPNTGLGALREAWNEILTLSNLPEERRQEERLMATSRTTLPNLSRLLRVASLARFLELSPAELAKLATMAGFAPFAIPQDGETAGEPITQRTIAFARLAQQVREAGLGVAQLAYLLGGELIAAGTPDDDALDALAGAIAAGLAEVPAHPGPAELLSEESLREMAALLVDGESAAFIAALVAGTLKKPAAATDAEAEELLQSQREAARAKLPLSVSTAEAEAIVPEWKELREGDEEEMEERQERLAVATAALHPALNAHLGRAIVRAAIQERFALDEAMVKVLLDENTVLRSAEKALPVDELRRSAADAAQARPLLRAIHRVVLLAITFGLQPAELRYVASHGDRFANLDFAMLGWGENGQPIERWRRLADYASLRDRLESRPVKLLDVFLAPEPGRVAALVQATGWPEAGVKEAMQALGLTTADLADERAIARLEAVVKLTQATGAPPVMLKKWAFDGASRDQAEAVVAAARRHSGDAAWLETAQAIHDPLRERQRDALVAHVLTFPEIRQRAIQSVDQLFEHFLIDAGTSACMLTSRVVQASAAVQLFVQRVHLGLEDRQDVPAAARLAPDAIDGEEWEWRKNYRVWEANRRIFLYPENYLLPELRDDRSPFFQELQSELTEGNLTAEQVERAVLNYLGKVEATSRLEIVGSYRQVEATPPTDILHVFGRTMSGLPRAYYYRRLVDKEWTPWEPVTVDIQGVERDEESDVSGVHLLPLVWRGKLFIFWPQFVTKQDNETPKEVDGGKIGASTGITVKRPEPYWEIRLAWSRLEDGRWTPKQISDVYFKRSKRSANEKEDAPGTKYNPARAYSPSLSQGVQFAGDPNKKRPPGELPFFQLQSIVDGSGGLTIEMIDRQGGQAAIGALVFADSYAPPVIANADNRTLVDLTFGNGRYQGQGSLGALDVSSTSARLLKTRLLGGADGRYVVTPLAQAGVPALDSPFFYGDARRLYYVQLWPHVETDVAHLGAATAKPASNVVAPVPATSFGAPQLTFTVGAAATTPGASPAESGQRFAVRAPSQISNGSPWTMATAELAPVAVQKTLSSGIGQFAGAQGSHEADFTSVELTGLPAGVGDALVVDVGLAQNVSVQASYESFFHPHVATFAERLRRGGLPALLSLDSQRLGAGDDTFRQVYQPVEVRLRGDLPRHDVDFAPQGAYAVYNWELFYHIPILLADELRKAGRYDDALRIIRLIFDPLDSTPGQGVERFWRVVPLRAPHQRIVELFEALAPGADPDKRQAALDQLGRMADHPFQPFRIARLRLGALQKAAVMLFCDICREAGDALFRQGTRESVGAALQYYVLMANVLGTVPERIRRTNRIAPQSFVQLRPRLDESGNAFVEAENELLFAGIGKTPMAQPGIATLLGAGRSLYFCIPQNEKLLGYWEIVQDRLFKLRNCMDIEGVVRQLPLFAPRIDPLLLARAAAAGLDLGAVLADLNAPLPRYRFYIMLQKALEMAGELKSLGASFLAALEKKDAEHLALMRAENEHSLMKMIRMARRWQVTEAMAALNTLLGARFKAVHELQHYAALLGVELPTIPALPGALKEPPEMLEDVALVTPLQANRGRFELVGGGAIMLSGAALGGAAGAAVGGPIGGAAGAAIGAVLGDIELANFDTGTKILRFEQEEIWQSFLAAAYSMAGTPLRALGSVFSVVPQAEISLKPLGLGGAVSFGGRQLQSGAVLAADILKDISTWHGFQAMLAGKQAGYVWRHQELMLRFNSAALEISHIDRQIVAAQIRLNVVENELLSHDRQAGDREEELNFMRDGQFTNEQLYLMLERSLGQFFNDAYKQAHDLARQAERAYRFQSGDETVSFVKGSYWEGQRRGLLCGEALYLDLKRMESAYLRQDRREYELTKHVSLRQLDPLALIDLRLKGACEFELPEWLFNLDFPGHFFRRIKSVAVSLPSVTGPYTSVGGTLTLLSSKVRVKATGAGDSAYSIDPVPIQSIAISGGQNDSGLFELSVRDERFLPFEGAGVAGRWRFELPSPAGFPAFDYESIADLVLHIRYTAREGGKRLAETQTGELEKALREAQESGPLTQLFSLRHEFPSEWHRLTNASDDERSQGFALPRAYFPLIFRGKALKISRVELVAVARGDATVTLALANPENETVMLAERTEPGEISHVKRWSGSGPNGDPLATVKDDPAKATWRLTVTGDAGPLEDVLLLFDYTVG